MKKTSKILLALVAALLMSSAAYADEVNETFSYADGDLVGNGGWTNHSGSAEFIQVVAGEAVLSHGGGSREDAGITFNTFTSGILTANFDISVQDDTPISGGDYEYFAHFMEDGDFNFRGRLDVVEATSGGDYTFGIASGDSTAEFSYGTDFTFGTVYNVDLSFDIDAGLASLTVDGGPTITTAAVFADETLNRFALRQSNSSNDETIIIDNLTITAIPEPGSAMLIGLAIGGIAVIRRRK